MKKIFSLILIFTISLSIFSCKEKEKKPFGAEDFSYDDIEKINNNGPKHESVSPENSAPFSNKVESIEVGPRHEENKEDNAPPTADIDPFASFDDAPIYQPEHRD